MTTAIRQLLPSPLQVVAFTVAGLVCLPLFYVGYLALTADPSVWSRL